MTEYTDEDFDELSEEDPSDVVFVDESLIGFCPDILLRNFWDIVKALALLLVSYIPLILVAAGAISGEWLVIALGVTLMVLGYIVISELL